MSLPFQNLYHKRIVAEVRPEESSAKPCYICYRQTSTVLITPDQADFFYTCPGHLKDRGFAVPVGPSAEELEKERARKVVEAEVEEKKRRWREKEEKEKAKKEKEKTEKKDDEKEAEKKKEDEKDGERKKDEEEKKDDKKDEKKDETVVNGTGGAGGEPRVFTLQKKIFDMRVTRLRQQQMAKKNAERLRNPTVFPSVPKGDPL